MALNIQDVMPPGDNVNIASTFFMSTTNTAVAMEDFNLDGFEDLFIMSDAEALAATAADINDKSAGMQFGPVTSLNSLPGTGQDPGDGRL